MILHPLENDKAIAWSLDAVLSHVEQMTGADTNLSQSVEAAKGCGLPIDFVSKNIASDREELKKA